MSRAVDKLTDAQVLALGRFATAEGKRWRAVLLQCFERARYPAHVTDSAALQQVRNNHGPSILKKLDTADVTREAGEVAHEWEGQS